MSLNDSQEQEYFASVKKMKEVMSTKLRLWDLSDIYNKVNPDEENCIEFLQKCYIDTVMETYGIVKFISRCVLGGIFYKPKDSDDDDDDDDDDEKDYMFKISVVRALSALNKARVKLAPYLLVRANDEIIIDHFHAYSGGQHRSLLKGDSLIELYRCLRHIHTGKFVLETINDDSKTEIAKFDALFCSDNEAITEYVENVERGIRDPIGEFDPAITNHNKAKYAHKVVFVCGTTGDIMR